MPVNDRLTGSVSFEISERFLAEVASKVKEHYQAEFDREYPRAAIESALRSWLDRRVDLVLEEAAELLTRPDTREAAEFARMLERSVRSGILTTEQTVEAEELHPMFSGYRTFSPERLTAMMGYLAGKGIELYKTKLNKLLFYADLTGFYLMGRGISGSRYVHLPYGPVPDAFEEMIDLGSKTGRIETATPEVKDSSAVLIRPGVQASDTDLSEDDRRILDWVAETYGHLTTAEITELSHREMAYRSTRTGEPIAYRYAEFLNTLPPKSLLGN